jgi:hypothetical protein
MQVEVEATRALERAPARFARARRRDQVACSHAGGTDPRAAFAGPVDRADRAPVPAAGYAPIPDPSAATTSGSPPSACSAAGRRAGNSATRWRSAAAGDGSEIRRAVDGTFFGGPSNPIGDVYFTVDAAERRFPHRGVGFYLRAGAATGATSPTSG